MISGRTGTLGRVSEDEELAELGSPDIGAAHLPGREFVPRYLVSRFAAQYRTIVEVLLEAQDTSLTGVAFDELACTCSSATHDKPMRRPPPT
jgi:hypothetical protein